MQDTAEFERHEKFSIQLSLMMFPLNAWCGYYSFRMFGSSTLLVVDRELLIRGISFEYSNDQTKE